MVFNVHIVMQVLAKKFGAALVSLEHRYYGRSSPFDDLSTNNLRYLSSKQALFDLAVFRQYYRVNFFVYVNHIKQTDRIELEICDLTLLSR